MSWDFLIEKNFWVLAVVLVLLCAGITLLASGNLPEVIDLTEPQRQTIILKEERACAREAKDLQRSFTKATDRCFERNRELIEALEDNTEATQNMSVDLNQAMYDLSWDLNKAIHDVNSG